MIKPVGILFDNTTSNFGDRAIGLALVQILEEAKLPYVVLPNSVEEVAKVETSTIIVGGGQLIRKDFPLYRVFRQSGRNILNGCGCNSSPGDLGFLRDYRYVTVRSKWDADIIREARPDVEVVPCVSLCLKPGQATVPDLPGGKILLIHVFHQDMYNRRQAVQFRRMAHAIDRATPDIKKVCVNFTSFEPQYVKALSEYLGWPVVSSDNPRDLIALIEHPQVVGTVSSSLHATLFTYRAQKPFLVFPSDRKMKGFLSDRDMLSRVWCRDLDSGRALSGLFGDQEKIASEWQKDKLRLDRHIETMIAHCRDAIQEGL